MKKCKKFSFKYKLLMFVSAFILLVGITNPIKTESYIKNRVIQLKGNGHACTGEQVRAPSGVDYILTAAHCSVLADNGKINAYSEYGTFLPRKVIAEDSNSDLLLLEGMPGLKGLSIAHSDYRNEEIRTFTHGAAMLTYKTTGVLIQDKSVEVPLFQIDTAEQEAACKQPKNKIYEINFIGISFGKLCLLDVQETATTAMIVPGSSGGPIVDFRGDLVGVVSAGGGGFGWLVRLEDIRAFLSNY